MKRRAGGPEHDRHARIRLTRLPWASDLRRRKMRDRIQLAVLLAVIVVMVLIGANQ